METHFPLHLVLSRFSDLNVTGRVPRKPRDFVGSGGFGDIYKGILPSVHVTMTDGSEDGNDDKPIAVAIKSIRASLNNGSTFEKAFCKELYIWNRLEHMNIVKLHGFTVEDNFPSLILEWVSNGTVIQYVKVNSECDRVKLCQGIADGIAYLHIQKNVIHSDLKGSNILVNDTGIPMLTDFGISRMTQYTQAFFKTTTRDSTSGSVRWTAYELFPLDLLFGSDNDSSEEDLPSRVNPAKSSDRDETLSNPNAPLESESTDVTIREEEEDIEGHHTKETDIWAFGMVIYEIMTEEIPYYKLRLDAQVLFSIIRKKYPEKPRRMSEPAEALWKICKECWVHDPKERLNIGDVIKRLSLIDSSVWSRALLR